MPTPLCHFEFMTRDPARLKRFYTALFDWSFDDHSMPGYTMIDAGVEPTGGLFPMPADQSQPCVNIYFQVADIEETLGKAVEGGGRILVEKTAIPRVGYFAMLADPDGNAIGIMQPER